MKWFHFLMMLLTVIFFGNSCENISPDSVELGVDFEWTKEDRGATKNPENRVSGISEMKTVRLSVVEK